VVIESVVGTFAPQVLFVVIGSMVIFSSILILAFWFHAHTNRMHKLNELKSRADAEKAALLVETARQQAAMERQLNEYIAHVFSDFTSAPLDTRTHSCSLANDLHTLSHLHRRFETRCHPPLQR
jgi:type II secretory pathway component PulJ